MIDKVKVDASQLLGFRPSMREDGLKMCRAGPMPPAGVFTISGKTVT